jgi:hypothetical protein
MQNSYEYNSVGLTGALNTIAPHDVVSVENPLRAQVTNLEYNGIITDGNYAISVVGSDGSSATSDPFVAVSQTAAQICAGVVAKCLLSPTFSGLLNGIGASVITTDNVQLAFGAPGVTYVVTPTGPVLPTQSNTTTAGYTEVGLGVILQGDGAGGFTTAYSDSTLAIGVTIRGVGLVQPLSLSTVTGYAGPCQMPVASMGEITVDIAPGITVLVFQKAYFNGTTKTWSNVTTGSHVLSKGAMWRSSGTGRQRVMVRVPSAS